MWPLKPRRRGPKSGILKIESDGTKEGTKVTFDGERVRYVQAVRWEIDVETRIASALIVVKRVKLDVEESIDAEDLPIVERD